MAKKYKHITAPLNLLVISHDIAIIFYEGRFSQLIGNLGKTASFLDENSGSVLSDSQQLSLHSATPAVLTLPPAANNPLCGGSGNQTNTCNIGTKNGTNACNMKAVVMRAVGNRGV